MYAVVPHLVKVGQSQVTMAQSLDTLTDSDFRGRGLFLSLAARCYKSCAADGIKGVYGFPNGSSAHGFFARLGWKQLDPVPFLIRPVGARYILSRVGIHARMRGSEPTLPARTDRVSSCPEDIDNLWTSVAPMITVGVIRDRAFLQWRLFDRPSSPYEVYVTRDDEGTPVAMTAVSVEQKHGATVGYLLEHLVAPGARRQGLSLVRFAVRRMAYLGADVVLAWSQPKSPSIGSLYRVGLLRLPQRVRPIELHFGETQFDGDDVKEPLVADRRNWYLSYLDSDTV
jgi:hypothetical protein